MVGRLLENGAVVAGYDPAAGARFVETLGTHGGFELTDSPYEAVNGASGLLLCTEWPELRRPDFDRIAELMSEKVVFDGRNIWDPILLEEKGFRYYGVGRPSTIGSAAATPPPQRR